MKGPQGVGKSHSIVNTVLKLLSTGNYLVTFIPDCAAWGDSVQFAEQVFASLGSSADCLGFDFRQMIKDGTEAYDLRAIIKEVSNALDARGKQWVFVFDQINKLFTKPQNRNAKDAFSLTFPYNLIADVMKTQQITCVISASANNEIAYKDHHEGFNEYFHTTKM